MASRKSSSFFIRAIVDADNTGTFTEAEVSLGAFVDALGQAVLLVKRIQVQYTDNSSTTEIITADSEDRASLSKWQLTTQSQSTIVTADNRSLIAGGTLLCARLTGGFVVPTETYDQNPSDWENGFIIAVDTIFLGGFTSTTMLDGVKIAVVMECEVMKLTKEAALALALSQQ